MDFNLKFNPTLGRYLPDTEKERTPKEEEEHSDQAPVKRTQGAKIEVEDRKKYGF